MVLDENNLIKKKALRDYSDLLITITIGRFPGSIKGIDFSGEIFYRLVWKWIGPGGPPGLQIQWRALKKSAVGSIPMHFRQKDSKASNPGGLPMGIFS